MTIIVKRRSHQSKFQEEMEGIGNRAREMSRRKLDSMSKFLIAQEKQENRLKGAAIRRYAKKNRMALNYHRKPWCLTRDNGDTIELTAGYYVTVNNVLQRIVAT